MNLVLS